MRRRPYLLAGTALLTAGLAAAPSLLASPATAGASKSPTVVTFWESHSAANQQGHAIADIVRTFEEANPSIKVEVTVTPASAKALAAVEAGDPPVMAMIGHGPQYGYEKAGALVNLHSFIYGKSGVPSAQLNGIWKGVWNAELTPTHQQYLFPVDVKVAEYFYNANIWHKAGLTKAPTTWAQLEADAGQIQKRTGDIGLAVRMDHNDWLPQLYSNGGSLLQRGSSTKLALDSPAMATTIAQLQHRDGAPGVKVISGYNTSLADFGSGKIGILENTADGYEMVREDVGGKFPVGVFGVPIGTTGKAYTLYQGLSFVIFSHATSAEQQAAWKFIKYFDSPAGQATWAVVGGEPPISTADIPAVEKQAGSRWSANPGPFAGTAVAIAELEQGTTIHKIIGPAQSEVDGVIQTQIQKVLQQGLSPSTAMKAMEAQGNAFLSGQAVA